MAGCLLLHPPPNPNDVTPTIFGKSESDAWNVWSAPPLKIRQLCPVLFGSYAQNWLLLMPWRSAAKALSLLRSIIVRLHCNNGIACRFDLSIFWERTVCRPENDSIKSSFNQCSRLICPIQSIITPATLNKHSSRMGIFVAQIRFQTSG